jgi:hypothetical protein
MTMRRAPNTIKAVLLPSEAEPAKKALVEQARSLVRGRQQQPCGGVQVEVGV